MAPMLRGAVGRTSPAEAARNLSIGCLPSTPSSRSLTELDAPVFWVGFVVSSVRYTSLMSRCYKVPDLIR